jgi:hypothetical protein
MLYAQALSLMLPRGIKFFTAIQITSLYLHTDELQTTENQLLTTGQNGPQQTQQNMPHQFNSFTDNDKTNNTLDTTRVKLCIMHGVGNYFYLQAK